MAAEEPVTSGKVRVAEPDVELYYELYESEVDADFIGCVWVPETLFWGGTAHAHAPRGARYFQTSDGSFRVVANGLHGGTARWTIAPAAPALHVVLEGGSAGIAKSVAGLCY